MALNDIDDSDRFESRQRLATVSAQLAPSETQSLEAGLELRTASAEVTGSAGTISLDGRDRVSSFFASYGLAARNRR